jgi:RNA polymerase sigma-70 factor (ECF subfamily)
MSGDLEFARLVDQYYGSLYRFALSLTRSEADACDLVQETFYIWARKGGQLREGSKVKSWLFTTLHREFLQSARRETRFPQVELDGAEAELPVTPEADWSRLDGRHLFALLQQIDEVFRTPMALFYLEDLTYEEIGEALEIPLGTVKSRLSRGISQLKQLLAGDIQKGNEAPDE